MSIALFFIVLLVIVVAHEFGHFIAAKAFGIRVDEFAVGFPPRLFGFKKGDTLYSFNALPLGGYVKIEGEDPEEPVIDPAHSFVNRPRYVQAAVVLAGIVFNFILAWFLLSAAFMAGVPATEEGKPSGTELQGVHLAVTSISPNSPAALAGLAPGDRVIAVKAGDREAKDLTPEAVRNFIASNDSRAIVLTYARGAAAPETVSLVPAEGVAEGRKAVGVALDMVGTVKLSPWQALLHGATTTYDLTKLTVAAFYNLIVEAFQGKADVTSLTGPVGLVGLVGAASQSGFSYLLTFIALISINIAVLNLVPFPALDGGRLLFIVLEGVTRRPIPLKFQSALNALGFILLIGLMLVVTYHDIVKLVAR